MILSIIIPMYKVEQYIKKCLLSCISQDIPYSEYEIICINDGSPDASTEIAGEIAKQNNNIRGSIRSRGPIINQTASKYNGGGHIYACGVRLKDFDEVGRLVEDLDKDCLNYKENQS